MTDHVQRALRWFLYTLGGGILLLLLWAHPMNLIVPERFWVDWRIFCLPCILLGPPYGPDPTAPIARIDSILLGLVLWMAFVFSFLIQSFALTAPILYGFYRFSKWRSAVADRTRGESE